MSLLGGVAASIIGLLGVMVGSGLTALLSRRNEVSRSTRELRQKVYFETLDAAFDLYAHVRDFGNHAPNGSDSDAEDELAAAAFERATDVLEGFPKVEARVATVGSTPVIDATSRFRLSTDRYFEKLGAQIDSDGVFRVAVARRHALEYALALQDLVRATRKDLGVAPLAVDLPMVQELRARVAQYPPAGWFPDPTGKFQWRFWNGDYWTQDVASGGEQSIDPDLVLTAS